MQHPDHRAAPKQALQSAMMRRPLPKQPKGAVVEQQHLHDPAASKQALQRATAMESDQSLFGAGLAVAELSESGRDNPLSTWRNWSTYVALWASPG
jgi:hypothetical protein